ncbi:unnamed protein product [Durusdinium trenchii]|uniref:Uncharacterized protein n=1 Tax=Durusdinium trenchii TaxID=1381693 RepID=A0ABP0JZ66_9DINO
MTCQVLDGEIGKTTLCVGAADRKCRGGETDVPGKLEWDDLIEAFDKYEVTEDSEGNEVLEAVESWDSSEHREQTIFVELVNEKVEGEFDEEWLVWVEARVTFKNELDSKCEEMPYSKRIFQLDPPGQIFYEGMERFLAWDPTSESLQELPNRLLAERVQVTNGGVSVMISFPARTPRAAVTAGFNEAGEQVNAHSTMEEDKGEALPGVSHRFIICRTWTLADFELMYASFCRMNSMEMERVTESALQEYGMVLAREQLKVVKGLRKPLLFEQVADEEVIDCPGLIMVADQNISARSALGPNIDITGGGSDAGGSILRTLSSGKTPLLSTASPPGRSAGTKAGPNQVIEKREYRSTFQSVGFLENAWPRYPHALDMAYGTGWMPSFLLLNSFYPVDNILNVIKAGANWLQLPVAYQTLQVIGGRSFADGLLNFATAPLYGIVPYCCEAFLYLLQMFSFLILPGMLLLFGMCYEFVGMFFAVNPEEYSLDSRTTSHIPDMIFSAVVSGHSVEDWMKGLSSVSFVALIGSTVTAAGEKLLLLETRPKLVNAMGNMLVSSYVWVILSFAISSILWFAMVVVIYPEQMLTALACAGGLAAIFTSMLSLGERDHVAQALETHMEPGMDQMAWIRLEDDVPNTDRDWVEEHQGCALAGIKLAHELERMLYEEIPEVLELVCDSFLEQYDKTSSGRSGDTALGNQEVEGRSKAVVATYRKLEEELAELPGTQRGTWERVGWR